MPEEKLENLQKQENESDDKARRIIVALTVGAVILLFILVIVMVYQLGSITRKNNERKELLFKIEKLDEDLKSGEETLQVRKERWYIEKRARELGFVNANDIVYEENS